MGSDPGQDSTSPENDYNKAGEKTQNDGPPKSGDWHAGLNRSLGYNDFLAGGMYGPAKGEGKGSVGDADEQGANYAQRAFNYAKETYWDTAQSPQAMMETKAQEALSDRRGRVLSKSVGPRGLNEPEDVNKVQGMLVEKGHLDEVSGYIGTKMLDATKAYQKENGLKVDGQINPGGPTEASLFGNTDKKSTAQTPSSPGRVSISQQMDNIRSANAAREKAAQEAEKQQRQEAVKQETQYGYLNIEAPVAAAPDKVGVGPFGPVKSFVAPKTTKEPSYADLYKSAVDGFAQAGLIKDKGVQSLPHVPQVFTSTPLDTMYKWDPERRALAAGSQKSMKQVVDNYNTQMAFDPGVRDRMPANVRDYVDAYHQSYYNAYGNYPVEQERNAHLAGLRAATPDTAIRNAMGNVLDWFFSVMPEDKTHIAELNVLHSGLPSQKINLFNQMADVLMADPMQFEDYPTELKDAYHAYMSYTHNPYTGVTGYPIENSRYGLLSGDEVTAATYTFQSALQSPMKNALSLAAGIDLLAPGGVNWAEYDQQMAKINAMVPKNVQFTRGYQSDRQLGGAAMSVVNGAFVPAGVLVSAGDVAHNLANQGVSVTGQRIGAAVAALTRAVSGQLSKAVVGQINTALQNSFGSGQEVLSEREAEIISGLLNEGIEMTVDGLITSDFPKTTKGAK